MKDRSIKKDQENKSSSYINSFTSVIFGGVIGGTIYNLYNKETKSEGSKQEHSKPTKKS